MIFYSQTFISLGSIFGSGMTGVYYVMYIFDFVELSFFSSNVFANSLGFDAQILTLTVTKGRFTSSFPNCMTFVSFSCLIALARTLRTIFSTNGESQNSSLIPEI